MRGRALVYGESNHCVSVQRVQLCEGNNRGERPRNGGSEHSRPRAFVFARALPERDSPTASKLKTLVEWKIANEEDRSIVALLELKNFASPKRVDFLGISVAFETIRERKL